MSKLHKSPFALNSVCSILLVEDDENHAQLVLRHFDRAAKGQMIVTRADSRASAFELLANKHYHLILLDLSLPDSPLETTVQSFCDKFPDLPIIVLTSSDDLELAQKAIDEGAQDYLVKSELSGTLLVRSIAYAIEQKDYSLELEKSNAELQRFASTVAHEIKNPLAVIISFFSILKRRHGKELSDKTMRLAEGTEARARELSQLITELLNFARFSPELELFEVDLNSIIEDTLASEKTKIWRKKAVITLDNLPTVTCDATLIRQVFQNLIDNALKYSDQGAKVHIGVEESLNHWTLSVSDNGIGIDDKSLSSIFEIFKRAKNVGEIPGTGIGLAFSRRIIQYHQGRIWCESKAASGSTFYFTLPKQRKITT